MFTFSSYEQVSAKAYAFGWGKRSQFSLFFIQSDLILDLLQPFISEMNFLISGEDGFLIPLGIFARHLYLFLYKDLFV